MEHNLTDKNIGPHKGRLDDRNKNRFNNQSRRKVLLDEENEIIERKKDNHKVQGWRDYPCSHNNTLFRKFFISRVGLPWNTIYSEIKNEIKGKYSVTLIKDALNEVEHGCFYDKQTNKLCYNYGYLSQFVEESNDTLYVDPKDGILKKTALKTYCKKHQQKAGGFLTKEILILNYNNIWYKVNTKDVETQAPKCYTLNELGYEVGKFNLTYKTKHCVKLYITKEFEKLQGKFKSTLVFFEPCKKRQLNHEEIAKLKQKIPRLIYIDSEKYNDSWPSVSTN
jgi:hypothetical protein